MPAIDKAHILKVNGFSHGLNFQQIASYIIILAQILLFSFFVVPNFVAPIKISFSILYYISTAIVIISGFKATVIDPTDEIVFLERRCRLEGKPFDEKQYPYQCEFCETSVHDDSKHCRACNRCVNDFDHHCNWINNCISKKNYKEFLTAIISLAISTSLFLTVGILFLVDYYTASLGVLKDVTIIKGNVHEKWKPILMAVFSGIAGIFCVLLLKLINFHIYLMKNKISTYEYIIRQRDIETKKQNVRKTKQSKERKVTPVPIQSKKNSGEIKKGDLEKKETLEAKDRKEEESESEEESDEEDAEESFGPKKGDRVVNAHNYASVQSGLSSHRDSKALLFARDPSHNRITIGGETERVDKLIRASSCTDIDIEQNLSGLTTPNEKLIRKRNSDLSPDVIISIKQDQNTYKSPRLKNLRVPSALSPFDSALHVKSRHDTSTEGALTFSSRTLSLTMLGQNSKLRPAFSTPKGNSEYGIFLKTESNLPVSPIGGHETDRQRLKTVSIVELDRLDIQTKQTSNVSQAPVTFATEQNF